MTFHALNWAIVLIPLAVVVWVAVKTQRHMKSVADFLVAGRAGGRYLVANATSEIGMGAITVIGVFEMYYQSGFVMGWYKQLTAPIGLIVVLTGFVVYRYRQSRVMTPAQFFEMRYSRRFRIFAGIMAWVSGTLNYALFPIVGARFFVYYCGFPQHLFVYGHAIPTEAIAMFILLGCALLFTLAGGQLTVMVTDCLEGIISNIMYLVVAAVLIYMFPWSQIGSTMAQTPPKQSLLNPFDAAAVSDFNVWYVLIGIFMGLYTTQAWQGGHAFKASASSAHETQMASILGNWRGQSRGVMIVLLAVCAYTFLHNPKFSSGAQWVSQSMAAIPNEKTANQMRIPLALSYFLPIGIKGMFASVMLFALFACDSSYLHSWGSIFAQDVILPFRPSGRGLAPDQHIRLIRWSIALVAAIAYVWGLLFPQNEYLLMYQMQTATFFMAGAGAANLGGFYTRKGTTAGAYAAMITGSSLIAAGMVLPRFVNNFPLNGAWISFIAMLAAATVYVVVSLLTYRKDFDLDRILHRDSPTVISHRRGAENAEESHKSDSLFSLRPLRLRGEFFSRLKWSQTVLTKILGITPAFTRGDTWIAASLFIWTMLLFAVFVIVTFWNLLSGWPAQWWATYWYIFGILIPFIIGAITCVWFTLGGLHDIRQLFRSLATAPRNDLDDGRVLPVPEIRGLEVKLDEPEAPVVVTPVSEREDQPQRSRRTRRPKNS